MEAYLEEAVCSQKELAHHEQIDRSSWALLDRPCPIGERGEQHEERPDAVRALKKRAEKATPPMREGYCFMLEHSDPEDSTEALIRGVCAVEFL